MAEEIAGVANAVKRTDADVGAVGDKAEPGEEISVGWDNVPPEAPSRAVRRWGVAPAYTPISSFQSSGCSSMNLAIMCSQRASCAS